MKFTICKLVILLLNLKGFAQTPTPRDCPTRCLQLPSSCADLLVQGVNDSGIYTVYPKKWFDKSNIAVYCDMETDGGGWTVFQRRDNFKVQQNFIQNWIAYRKGFGKLDKDFWLGNDNIHILSSQEYVTLRIDMEDFSGTKHYVIYNKFLIAGSHNRYQLKIEQFSGTAADSLNYHNGAPFVTFDDGDVSKCAEKHKGGWWFKSCRYSSLNGIYKEGSSDNTAIYWHGFGSKSLKKTEMKIRPSYFSTRLD